ncbi:MAG: hypothetical protein ACYCT1_02040 [Steroidobacteraceae bacterium]
MQQSVESQGSVPVGSPPVDDWRAKYDDGTYPVAFWDWLTDNMHVFEEFVRLALRVRARRAHYSADCLCHVLRFESDVRGRGDEFKINNTYVSGLSRLAMEVSPRLRGFFEIRQPPGSCGRQGPSCDNRRRGSRA